MDVLNPVLQFFGESPYLKSLAIVILAIVSANIFSYLLSKLITGLIKYSGNRFNETVAQSIRKPLYWTVICVELRRNLTHYLHLKLPRRKCPNYLADLVFLNRRWVNQKCK